MLGYATMTTPQQQAVSNANQANSLAAAADPFGFSTNPATQAVGGIGNMQSNSYSGQLANQARLYGSIVGSASPYSVAYGVNPANAPAPAPVGGYQSGYGGAPAYTPPGWTATNYGNTAGFGF
jgi:hypothetical protein